MLTATEAFLVVPHLHDGANYSLRLTVGLRSIDTSKFLSDTIGLAGLNNFMVLSTPVFFATIRIDVINLIRAFINHPGEKTGSALL